MAKIKLTKNESKKQKDNLKRFKRYLPTLQLKKQQLQMEVRKVDEALRAGEKDFEALNAAINEWVSVLNEDAGIKELISVQRIETEASNIAGVDIPVFKRVLFEDKPYSLFSTPLWVDFALAHIRKMIEKKEEINVLKEQYRLLKEELMVTTQRVNLFEKVKIPETSENIRVIQIYLGDQQTAAVVRGKISKKKLLEKQKA